MQLAMTTKLTCRSARRQLRRDAQPVPRHGLRQRPDASDAAVAGGGDSVPAAHGVQEPLPASEYVPAEQAVADSAPAAHHEPAGHVSQSEARVAPAVLRKVPRLHRSATLAPVSQYLPLGQAERDV